MGSVSLDEGCELESEACILRFSSLKDKGAFIEWAKALAPNPKALGSFLDSIDASAIDN
jgi:hypothetical protein